MSPCLVRDTSPIRTAWKVAPIWLSIEGDEVGQIVLRGAGAGEGPTASAVLSDIAGLSHAERSPAHIWSTRAQLETLWNRNQRCRCGIHLPPITCVLPYVGPVPARLPSRCELCIGNNNEVSIRQMRQYDHEGDENAPVLIVTHETSHKCANDCACTTIDQLPHDWRCDRGACRACGSNHI